jgi:hypothetical protein
MVKCNLCNENCSRYRVIDSNNICQDCLGFNIKLASETHISYKEVFEQQKVDRAFEKEALSSRNNKRMHQRKRIISNVLG